MDERIKNIENQEKNLDDLVALTNNLESLVDRWITFKPQFDALMSYYTGQAWMQDVEDSNNEMFPKDLKCGVLSEDAVYDIFRQQRDLNFKMIRIALDYLEK